MELVVHRASSELHRLFELFHISHPYLVVLRSFMELLLHLSPSPECIAIGIHDFAAARNAAEHVYPKMKSSVSL